MRQKSYYLAACLIYYLTSRAKEFQAILLGGGFSNSKLNIFIIIFSPLPSLLPLSVGAGLHFFLYKYIYIHERFMSEYLYVHHSGNSWAENGLSSFTGRQAG